MRFIVLGMSLPLLVATAAAAQSANPSQVTPAGLIVRSGPGTNYRQLGVLAQGAAVTVTGPAQGNFVPVSFSGGQGWVPAQFINTSGAPLPTPPAQQSFAPTPLGGAANQPAPATSGAGGVGNFVQNLLGNVGGNLIGNLLGGGGSSSSSNPLQSLLGSGAGGSNPLQSLLGAGGGSGGSLIQGLLGGSNLLQGALGGGGGASNPLGALLGGSSSASNPLGALLGNASAGASGSNPLGALLGNASAGASGSNPLAALLGGNNSGGANGVNPVSILSGNSPFAQQQGASGSTPVAQQSGGFAGNPGAVGKPATVTATSLNVRSGPGTQYRVIGLQFQGAQVQPTANQGAWFKITQSDGTEGWVHGAYLSQGGAQLAPTSSIPSGGQNAGIQGALPGSSSGGTPAGAGNEQRSKAGFIQLKSSGTGYYGYYTASRKWGTPALIYGIMRVGQRLQQGGIPALGVGDISAENGGQISGHASHQKGVDVDCRPFRSDGARSPVTIDNPAYSQSYTATALRLFVAETKVSMIFFNDQRLIKEIGPVRYWKNHANHFHARVN